MVRRASLGPQLGRGELRRRRHPCRSAAIRPPPTPPRAPATSSKPQATRAEPARHQGSQWDGHRARPGRHGVRRDRTRGAARRSAAPGDDRRSYGVLSRRRFTELAELEVARAAGRDAPLTLLLLDVDRLAVVNDTHGHVAGDQLLSRVAAGWHATLRPGDLMGRLGSDEFVVLLPATGADEARPIAERLRSSTPLCSPSGHGAPWRCTSASAWRRCMVGRTTGSASSSTRPNGPSISPRTAVATG